MCMSQSTELCLAMDTFQRTEMIKLENKTKPEKYKPVKRNLKKHILNKYILEIKILEEYTNLKFFPKGKKALSNRTRFPTVI